MVAVRKDLENRFGIAEVGAFELPVPPQVSFPIVDVRFAKRGPALPTISGS